MRRADASEIASWDALITTNPAGPEMLQTRAWGELKAQFGWKPHYLIEEGHGPVAALFLSKHIPTFGSIWYCPKGPGMISVANIRQALTTTYEIDGHAFVVKVEPEMLDTTGMREEWMAAGFVPAHRNVQLTSSVMTVDLDHPYQDIRSRYKAKCRYNIGVAERHGVEIEWAPNNEASFEVLYTLLQQTLDRAAFTYRSKEYFFSSWRLWAASNQGRVVFARFEGKPIAGVFLVTVGHKAWYKDGGSTRSHRNVMAPYLLHDAIIQRLNSENVSCYDLGSVPPVAEANAEHPLWGLYRFKSGFASNHRDFIGTQEWILHRKKVTVWDRWMEGALDRLNRTMRANSLY